MYYRSMRKNPSLFSILLTGFSLFSAFWALRLAYAEYLFRSTGQVNRAITLAPGNPDYAVRSGDFRRAVQLNPYHSEAWIELALQAEISGKYADAEAHLMRANEVDKTFAPRWAAANFYFRQQKDEQFWRWMRLATERSYGDMTALYRLAWRYTDDSRCILDRMIPNNAEFLGSYLDFLKKEMRWRAAAEAAEKYARAGGSSGKMLELCEELLSQQQVLRARQVWKLWEGRRASTAEPANLLSNPKLSWKPSGMGFDWRLPWREGVVQRWVETTGEMRILLDGRQDEHTELLTQIVPVAPDGFYSFRYQYRPHRVPARTGLRWRGTCTPGGNRSFEQLIEGDGESWSEKKIEFRTSMNCELLQLRLLYERLPGTARIEADFSVAGPFVLVRSR